MKLKSRCITYITFLCFAFLVGCAGQEETKKKKIEFTAGSCGASKTDCSKEKIPDNSEGICIEETSKCSFKCKTGFHSDSEKNPTSCKNK